MEDKYDEAIREITFLIAELLWFGRSRPDAVITLVEAWMEKEGIVRTIKDLGKE